MLKLLHYQENGENKGSQMGHTKKYLKKLPKAYNNYGNVKYPTHLKTHLDLT
jgi:hypothetical protein